jgi:hypothetical protein
MDQELKGVARTLVWWKPPETVDLHYLVRRTMEMGTPEMLATIRQQCGEQFMREALVTAEQGNFSELSWNYWHVVFDIRPTPPLPQREVPDSPYVSAEIRGAVRSVSKNRESAKDSSFGDTNVGQGKTPELSADAALESASPEVLLALKLSVIHQRRAAKDYLDIHALLKSGLSLAAGLSHLDAIHLLATNWTIALKTLVYFKGGDLDRLPEGVKRDLEEAVRNVREVPTFSGIKAPIGNIV